MICRFMMFSTVSGILMALFLNNSGGAWDNTKKLVETGAFGGRNSEAHKAAITGDTVGDPAKAWLALLSLSHAAPSRMHHAPCLCLLFSVAISLLFTLG